MGGGDGPDVEGTRLGVEIARSEDVFLFIIQKSPNGVYGSKLYLNDERASQSEFYGLLSDEGLDGQFKRAVDSIRNNTVPATRVGFIEIRYERPRQ